MIKPVMYARLINASRLEIRHEFTLKDIIKKLDKNDKKEVIPEILEGLTQGRWGYLPVTALYNELSEKDNERFLDWLINDSGIKEKDYYLVLAGSKLTNNNYETILKWADQGVEKAFSIISSIALSRLDYGQKDKLKPIILKGIKKGIKEAYKIGHSITFEINSLEAGLIMSESINNLDNDILRDVACSLGIRTARVLDAEQAMQALDQLSQKIPFIKRINDHNKYLSIDSLFQAIERKAFKPFEKMMFEEEFSIINE